MLHPETIARRLSCVLAATLAAVAAAGCQRTAPSPTAPPDPAELLAKYEKSLLPYQHFQGKWSNRHSSDQPASESKPESQITEYTVLRDGDRTRIVSRDLDHGGKILRTFESIGEIGRNWISAWSEGFVCSETNLSPEHDWGNFGASPFGPLYGCDVQNGQWFPDLLRTAILSARTDKIEGDSVCVLRGVVGDYEIEVWLDPARDYASRRIIWNNQKDNFSDQLDVRRWQQQAGHWFVSAGTVVMNSGPRPMLSAEMIEKILPNGEHVFENPPALDKNGNAEMSPGGQDKFEFTLLEIQFDPHFDAADFEFSLPIANGTPVTMQDDRGHEYVWQDGAIALLPPKTYPDSDKTLQEGIAAAKAADKKLLVQFGGPECAPCRLLKHFLEENKDLFDDAYLILDIEPSPDEWIIDLRRPETLIHQLLAENRGGVPWLVILDADGHELTNSNGPNGNIGFPSNPESIAHFVAMIQKSSALPQDRLDKIRQALQQSVTSDKRETNGSARREPYEAVTAAINIDDWKTLRRLAPENTKANSYIERREKDAIRVGKLMRTDKDFQLNGKPCTKYSFALEYKDGRTHPHWLEVVVDEAGSDPKILDFWEFGW